MAIEKRSPVQLLEEVVAALREQDFDRFASCYAEDAAVVRGGTEIRGRTAIVKDQRKEREQLPDLSFNILRVFPLDDSVAWEARVQGTNTGPLRTPGGVVPPTGRRVDFTAMAWLEAEDGLIVRERQYWDQLVVLSAQLGLLDLSPASE